MLRRNSKVPDDDDMFMDQDKPASTSTLDASPLLQRDQESFERPRRKARVCRTVWIILGLSCLGFVVGLGMGWLVPSAIVQSWKDLVAKIPLHETLSDERPYEDLNTTSVAPLERLYIFGDSYSTIGFSVWEELPTRDNRMELFPTIDHHNVTNVPAAFGNPPYPGETFCAGPNWVGNLVHTLAHTPPLTYDFAVAGSPVDVQLTPVDHEVIDFPSQVDLWMDPALKTGWDSDTSAIVVWFGQNDLMYTWEAQNYSSTVAPVYDAILNSYFQQIDRLFWAGARKFILVGLEMSVTQSPLFSGLDDVVKRLIESDTAIWNAELRNRVIMFRGAHPDAIMTVLAIAPAFQKVFDNPLDHAVSEDIHCENADGTSCAWWDYFHPGQAIHKEVAIAMDERLKAMGFQY